MSAELLRRAAEAERAEWSDHLSRSFPKAQAVHFAVADVLDAMADGIARRGVCARLTPAEKHAIALAGQILEEKP